MNDSNEANDTIAAHEDDALIELLELLQSIDDSEESIKLNTNSIRDNNSGRILF